MAAAVERNAEMEKAMSTATHISITVKSQDGKETFYKIRRDTPLKKLLISYCQRFYLDYQATNFFLEGEHFNRNKNPNELNLEDEVEILSMGEQLGGGGEMNYFSCIYGMEDKAFN